MLVAAGMLLIASVLLWGYPGFLRKGTIEYYNEGAFDKALNACKTIEAKKTAQVCLEIVSVESDTCLAKIVKGKRPLAEGMRVEAGKGGPS